MIMSATSNEYEKMFGNIVFEAATIARCACVACNSCTCACSCRATLEPDVGEIEW